MNIITIISITSLLVCLFLMYCTNHGVPGIQMYNSNFRPLDMRFRYSSETLYETFTQIGTEGMKAYHHFLILDFFFIVSLLATMLIVSMKITDNNIFKIALIIFASSRALFDILENTFLMLLLNTYPEQNVILAELCSVFTTTKFISLFAWAGCILAVFVLKLI